MNIVNATYIRKLIGAVALFGVLSGTVMAIPVIGSVEYAAGVTAKTSPSSASTTLGNADYLDFSADAEVIDALGAFAGLTGTDLLLNDFFIDPFSTPTLVWTSQLSTALFTFTLTSLNIVEQNDSWLKLSGSGYFTDLNGYYEQTAGNWSLTTQDVTPSNPATRVSFSASTATVPEPNALMLLGLSLVVLAFASSRRKQA